MADFIGQVNQLDPTFSSEITVSAYPEPVVQTVTNVIANTNIVVNQLDPTFSSEITVSAYPEPVVQTVTNLTNNLPITVNAEGLVTVIDITTTYYLKGIDSTDQVIYWSSQNTIDTNPAITQPQFNGSIVWAECYRKIQS